MLKLTSIAVGLLSVPKFETNTLARLLGVCSIILSLGFLFSTTSSPGYNKLYEIATPTMWSIYYLVYGTFNLLYSVTKLPLAVKLLTTIMGIWAWSLLLLSIFIYTSALLPGQLLFVLPLVLELWSLVAYLLYVGKGANICQQ